MTAFLDDRRSPSRRRRRRRRRRRGAAVAASKMAGAAQAAAARQEEVHKARVEAAEALEATLAAAEAVWPEVEAVLDKTLRSLSLKGQEPLCRREGRRLPGRRSGRASASSAADRDDALIDDDAARALPPLRSPP